MQMEYKIQYTTQICNTICTDFFYRATILAVARYDTINYFACNFRQMFTDFTNSFTSNLNYKFAMK